MRGAPHSGLASVICLIKALTFGSTAGRPPVLRSDSFVQKSRKTWRCQPMTVSGLTMIKDSRQPLQMRDNQTQKRRSLFLIAGRFRSRLRTANCRLKARFSSARPRRSLKLEVKRAVGKSRKLFMALLSLAIRRGGQQNLPPDLICASVSRPLEDPDLRRQSDDPPVKVGRIALISSSGSTGPRHASPRLSKFILTSCPLSVLYTLRIE